MRAVVVGCMLLNQHDRVAAPQDRQGDMIDVHVVGGMAHTAFLYIPALRHFAGRKAELAFRRIRVYASIGARTSLERIMRMTVYRMAAEADLAELARMRW